MMNDAVLISALTDYTLDCSNHPILDKTVYTARMAVLVNRKRAIISTLRSSCWDYVSKLISELPINHTPLKLLTKAYKRIYQYDNRKSDSETERNADRKERALYNIRHVEKALMVYQYMVELSVILTHIIIIENNADNTIDYNYSDFNAVDHV